MQEPVSLRFLGATGTVTGSRFLISSPDAKVLVDCGLYQGVRELRRRNWATFPVPVHEIDAVLSHAHLDHCGFLPRLVRRGYNGPAYCSPWTAKVAPIVLRDAAHLQEEDAEFAARILVDQPLPAGNRVAIVGNAGGLGVLGADAATSVGLVAPEVHDLGAGATPSTLAGQIRAMASSGDVDAVVVMFGATRSNEPAAAIAEIACAADDFPDLTMAAVLVGLPQPPSHLGQRRMPVYDLPEQAMRALGHAARYAAWRREPLGNRPELSDVDYLKARVIVEQAATGWQQWEVATALLTAYRIPVLAGVVVGSLDDALGARLSTVDAESDPVSHALRDR